MIDSRQLAVAVSLVAFGVLAGCSSTDTAPTIIPVASNGGSSTGGQANTGTAGGRTPAQVAMPSARERVARAAVQPERLLRAARAAAA